MPRKNKRKFFKSNNNSNKNVAKENASNVQSATQAELEKENVEENVESIKENASTSVANESSMMSHIAIKVPVHNDETMLASNSFIDSSPKKTVITLKVIQFIGQLPQGGPSDDGEHCRVSTVNNSSIEKDDNDFNAYKVDGSEEKTVQSDVNDGDGVGVEPKIDRNENEEKEVSDENTKEHNKKVKGRLYDKNYRVESPPQVIATVKQTKHYSMLIQEIAPVEDHNKIQEIEIQEAKSYRVESPDTCSVDTNNNIITGTQNEVLVQEICESSSSESIKNEPQPTPTIETLVPQIKVINIQELPSEKVLSSSSSSEESITSKIECKTGKKLNKAEEAIIEALYNNPELLQRNNNRLLDVITEESCDGSDVERQSNDNKLNDADGSDDDNDNGDVFFDISMESAKKPPLFRKRSNIHRKQIAMEQPVLINTKIIETNTVPESCNKWELSEGDSELQAELVYLNSTSSSCTDLDERSDITDTEGEEENETSEDTESNSMLENLTLPPLDDFVMDPPIEFKFQQSTSVHQTLSYQQESTAEQKLPNIIEEDEEQQQPLQPPQQQQCTLDISESQQCIEDVNKELHHMCTEHNEQQQQQHQHYQKHIKGTEINLSAPLPSSKSMLDNTKYFDKNELSHDKPKQQYEGRTLIYDSGLTLSSFTRTNSSDSSSDSTKSGSTTNSQCTIIRQSSIIDNVQPLSELCMTAMGKHNFTHEIEETTTTTASPKYTIYKTKNCQSLNAPTIPVITEIELMYAHDDEQHQDKQPDKSITLLQVAPDISFTIPNRDDKRWYGLQSSAIPNLLVALSPMQKQYMIKTEQYNNTSSPIADLLLDMHNKFVERRAYHETIKSTNTNGNSFTEASHLLNIVKVPESQSRQLDITNKPDNFANETQRKSKSKSVESDTVQVPVASNNAGVHLSVYNQIKDTNKSKDITSLYQNKVILASSGSSGSSVGVVVGGDDNSQNIKMNSIRNCILRDEFFKMPSVPIQLADDYVDTKQCELQNELKTLEAERQKIEEELKNIQSLKHFKNEEHLFNQRKLPLNTSCNMSFNNKDNTTTNDNHNFYSELMNSDTNRLSKTSSSDFNEFINSNEQLQREMHDEWQHKVLERNERKLHRILKITTVSSEYISNVDCHNGERRASDLAKYYPIENEFLSKVKERRKRLSLQSDSDLNSSTESLHHQNERERAVKNLQQSSTQNKENIPVHLQEFLNYCDEEIQLNEETNNSDDGGEFGKQLSFVLLFGSLCVAGFYIGRYFF